MSAEVHTALSASDLPVAWDEMSLHPFQHRSFLSHAEQFNPCGQRYYLLHRNGGLAAGASVYSLNLNLFAFRSAILPIKSTIVGLPCSVSAGGLVGAQSAFGDLLSQIRQRECGLLVVLNLDSPPDVERMIAGRTLPTVVFRNRFTSWGHYMDALRSDYRRRILRLSRPFRSVETRRGPCSAFSAEMYALYLDVLKRSEGKLETLPMPFLRELPNTFQLTICNHHTGLLGWYISTSDNGSYYFFLGGVDYPRNSEFNIYFNILFLILKDAIDAGAATVDFGQTAAIAKTRLGGQVVEKSLLCSHSNRIVHRLLRMGRGLMEYAKRPPMAHVFGDAS